jgi:hypothetical protein
MKIKEIINEGKLSLEDFLNGSLRDSYIRYKNIDCYFKKSTINIDGERYNALIISNVKNIKRSDNIQINPKKKRTGLYKEFSDYTEKLARDHGFDGIYVESIVNQFLPSWLERNGYVAVNIDRGTINYWKNLKS